MIAKEIAFVCYGVTNLKKSREFYEKILGLKPTSVWDGGKTGFVEYSFGKGRAHTLAIGAGAANFKPGKAGATVALEVTDFAQAVAKLEKHKVKFVLKPKEHPSCHMALILDPDGNQIMLHKRKK